MMSNLFSLVIVLTIFFEKTIAHGRWKCPLPRDELDENGQHITFDNTANKNGACGPQSGNWGYGSVRSLKPGWTTLIWEESIAHTGGPFRIAILDETEKQYIVLLDHIPHNENSSPTSHVEKTYTQYKMSVNIPNIQCAKCSLQFLYIMTDKTVNCNIPTCYYNPEDSACKGSTDPNADKCSGAPNNNVCVQENECFSNYHSCTDVTILGTLPFNHFSTDSQPLDWPYRNMKFQYYSKEVGDWSTDGWLQGIPSNYTTTYDSLTC